jgi:hypothetical protein
MQGFISGSNGIVEPVLFNPTVLMPLRKPLGAAIKRVSAVWLFRD